jgi:hypothetical protein
MDRARGVVAVVLVCLVGLSVGAPLVAAPAGASDGADIAETPERNADSPLVQSEVDPDVVVMRVTLAPDGTARWAVAYRTRLDDENTTAAFESVQSDVEDNASAFTDRFATGMRRAVRSTENATGREMALRNVTVTATKEQLGQEYGVLTYRFTWTNFAAVEGDRIRAGDALSGLFLDSETSLVVAWPEGYAVERVTPRPTENRTNEAVWRGQIDFGPEQPRVVLAPGGGSGGGGAGPLVAGAVLAVLAVATAGWLVATRVRGDGTTPGAGGAGDGATGGDGAGTTAGGSAGGPDSTDAGEDAAGDDGPPEELLSNEERVIRLLEDNGGRIKQQRIAEEYDWTDAKTSQVVGSLREDGEVETFRIGRENVVALPEESDL